MSAPGPAPEPWQDGPDVDLGRLVSRTLRVSLLLVVLLAACDVLFAWVDVLDNRAARGLFNAAAERSIPTWCSTTFSCLAGLFALAAAWGARRRGLARGLRKGLVLAGLFFIHLAMDDAVELHERLGTQLAKGQGGEETLVSYGWQTFVLPVYLLVGVAVLVLVGPELARRGLLGWFLAGGALMAFAQGLDWIEGRDDMRAWIERTAKAWETDVYNVSHPPRLLEEVCEMLGLVLVGQAFLRLFASIAGGLRLRLAPYRTPA
jgi:hypothetical protein